MSKVSLADGLGLSVAERIRPAEDIWDTIPKASEAPKVTGAQRAELDRRLEAHRKNPEAGSSWEDVKARIPGHAQGPLLSDDTFIAERAELLGGDLADE